MPVEIGQLVVKSTVQPEDTSDTDDCEERASDMDEVRDEIMRRCRQMVLDLLRERRER